MKKWGILGVLVLVLIGAGLYARDWYFNDKPVDMADEYRETAEVSARSLTGSMDRVHDSFDDYLRATTFPANRFRNVDDVGELLRRIDPILRDADDALNAARNRIKTARTEIKRNRDDLLDTPTAKYLEDADPIVETEDAADTARDYLKRIDRYLNSFDKFLDYEKKNIDLRRRALEIAAQNVPDRDATLEEFKASVEAELEETKALLDRRLEIKPARDTEKLNDNSIESLNVTIDYLERVKLAFENLDPDGLDAAGDDYIDEIRSVGKKSSDLIAELSAESGLSVAARTLSKRADELQDQVAELGTGKPRKADPRRRPPPLGVPRPGAGEGGEKGPGENSQPS